MAGNSSDGLADDFFEQILAVPSYASAGDLAGDSMALQLGYGGGDASGNDVVGAGGGTVGYASISSLAMPLGLNLGHGLLKSEDRCGTGKRFRDELADVNISSTSTVREPMQLASLFPPLGQLHADTLRLPGQPLHQLHQQEYDSLVTCGLRTKDEGLYQPFHGQPTHFPVAAVPVPPVVRPRVRARRGQATDPHSIAERLRRERIAERMKALQELVPSANKTDRAAMLDEIVDYVKFLRLQVKVLSMSRVGGAGAVTQLVTDGPQSSIEGEEQVWEKWASGETEEHVAKLMEEDVGAAMQFLQSKALCIMPISLASTIFQPHHLHHLDVKPETDT